MTEGKNDRSIWRLQKCRLADGEMKFCFANGWNMSYGDNKQDRQLEIDGENIKESAGIYDIVLDLRDPKFPNAQCMCTMKFPMHTKRTRDFRGGASCPDKVYLQRVKPKDISATLYFNLKIKKC